MAKSRSLPLANYPNGSRSVGPIAVPNGLDGFQLNIGRCTTATPTLWPNASTVLTIEVFSSFDGGATFQSSAKFEIGGGILSKRGVEIAEWIVSYKLKPTEPTHIRVDLTVSGGPLRTYLDATVL